MVVCGSVWLAGGVVTCSLDRFQHNFAHMFLGPKSQSSLLMVESAPTILE